jgi:hypothetical protein
MKIEKPARRLPDWSYSAATGAFSRRLPDLEGNWVKEDDTAPIRVMFDIGGAMHLGDRFEPSFNRRWEAYALPQFELSDDLGEDGKPVEKYGVAVPVWSPVLGGVHLAIFRGAYAIGAVSDLILHAENASEAANEEIPVVDWLGASESTAKRGPAKGKRFYSPRFKIVGWMSRPEMFGPRLNPAPKRSTALPSSLADIQFGPSSTPQLAAPDLFPVGATTASPDAAAAEIVARAATSAKGRKAAHGSDVLDDAVPF